MPSLNTTKRPRGRPRKNVLDTVPVTAENRELPKKRGRPRKDEVIAKPNNEDLWDKISAAEEKIQSQAIEIFSNPNAILEDHPAEPTEPELPGKPIKVPLKKDGTPDLEEILRRADEAMRVQTAPVPAIHMKNNREMSEEQLSAENVFHISEKPEYSINDGQKEQSIVDKSRQGWRPA